MCVPARKPGEGVVKTPDMEALDISRMSDSLYELQSDIKKLAVQQSQIQSMMQTSSTQVQFYAVLCKFMRSLCYAQRVW